MLRRSILIAFFCFAPTAVSLCQELAGVLRADTTLTAALSPWRITADVVVPAGITLQIEPGATLHFHDSAGIQIQSGRLVALGEPENRITLTRRPGTSDSWNGLQFNGTMQDNMLCHADMRYGDNLGQIIDIHRAQVVLDHCSWNSTDRTIIEVYHPAAIIQHCTFPSVDEVEVIHGEYLQDEDYMILIGNTFGSPLGYNDVIDFTDCKRPGPILEVYDNHFLGGSDDGLDLDGADAYIEGNTFMNFHKGHDGSSTANAIATGLRNGKTSDIVVVRNLFYDNDHAVLLKEDCSMQAENNTFVKSDSGVINFSEWPDRDVDPGKGAALIGNIFWNYGRAFRNQFSQPGEKDPAISFSYGIIDVSQHALGVQNRDQDPQFIDAESDFHLKATSPAIGAGPNGLDMGAYVPPGASISGEPPDTTAQTSATLTIGGPGVVSYKFALDDPDQWSEERSVVVEPFIVLENLPPNQSHTVYVKGKSIVGWQKNPDYAVSKTWFITDSPAQVQSAAATLPVACRLYDAYPNPCNERTLIRFDLPMEQRVRIEIYDALGRSVGVLIDEVMPAGTLTLHVDGQRWPTGVYWYRMSAGDFKQAKRLILIR